MLKSVETRFESQVSMTERVLQQKKVFKALAKDELFLECLAKQLSWSVSRYMLLCATLCNFAVYLLNWCVAYPMSTFFWHMLYCCCVFVELICRISYHHFVLSQQYCDWNLVVGSGWTSTNSFRTRSSGLPSRCVSRCCCLLSRSCVTVTVCGGVTTKTSPPTESLTPSPSLNPNKTLNIFLCNLAWHTGYPLLYFYIFIFASSHSWNPNMLFPEYRMSQPFQIHSTRVNTFHQESGFLLIRKSFFGWVSVKKKLIFF